MNILVFMWNWVKLIWIYMLCYFIGIIIGGYATKLHYLKLKKGDKNST